MSGFFIVDYVDQTGAVKRSIFYCDTLDELHSQIAALNCHLIRAHRKIYSRLNAGFVSLDYRVRFLRALLTHIKNAQSSGRALALVIESEYSTRLRAKLLPALDVLNRGGDFSQALDHLRIFNRTVISILRGAESVGDIGKGVEAAVRYLRSLREAQHKLLIALGALGFDLFAAFSSIGLLQYVALPWLEQNGMKQGRPEKIAAFKAAIANAYVANSVLLWTTIMACALITGILAVGLFGNSRLRLLADQALLRIPVLRALFIHRAIADTFGIVATMLSGRVTFERAITTAQHATLVPTVSHYWSLVLRRLSNGIVPSLAMRSDMLAKAEILAITNSPDTTQLSGTLLEIAADRELFAKEAADHLIQFAIAVAMAYMLAVFGIGFYVLDVQGTGMDAMMEMASGGGF